MKIDIRQVSTFIISVVIATSGAILLSTQFALKTSDDSIYLQTALNKNRTRQVLGASTNSLQISNVCPNNKQVLGYIDYSGNKLILSQENKLIQPTACFESEEQANADGYFFGKINVD